VSGWTALRVRIPQALEDPILLILHEAGTLGVQIDDGTAPAAAGAPLAAATAPEAERIATAWFREGTELRRAEEALARLGPGLWLGVAGVEDGRWVERQEEERRPISVGARFLIIPGADPRWAAPSMHPPGAGGRAILVIPPKRAFGTGEHATTRLCLELHETVPVRGISVLDFGTGSGILALAAAALGAEEVLGLDDDPEAIELARENALLNHRALGAARVRLEVGSLPALSGRYALVLANIFAGVLEQAAPRLALCQAGGGCAILSGFSPREAAGVAHVWERSGYRQVALRESGEWAALLLERTR
jgi:ribosomal protein L11 methyltransferase